MRLRSTLTRLEREHAPRGKAVILETPQQFRAAQAKPDKGATYFMGRHLPETVQTIAIGKATVHEPSQMPVRDRPEPCPVDSANRPISGVNVKDPDGWGEGEYQAPDEAEIERMTDAELQAYMENRAAND